MACCMFGRTTFCCIRCFRWSVCIIGCSATFVVRNGDFRAEPRLTTHHIEGFWDETAFDTVCRLATKGGGRWFLKHHQIKTTSRTAEGNSCTQGGRALHVLTLSEGFLCFYMYRMRKHIGREIEKDWRLKSSLGK